MNGVAFKILFKPGDQFPIVRRKHFTVTEIFAFTGGLLGLFLGISVISFLEVVNELMHPLFKKLSMMLRFEKSSVGLNTQRNKLNFSTEKVKSYCSFYLRESSVHSFSFISDATNWFQRLFWVSCFCLSMTGCTLMVLQLHRTMDFKAVTLIIDDQVMDVFEVPFPAVTIFGSFPSIIKLWYPELKSMDEWLEKPGYYDRGYDFSFNLSRHAEAKNPTSR